eukprot:6153610-Pyramimonas_sp.AAC.1
MEYEHGHILQEQDLKVIYSLQEKAPVHFHARDHSRDPGWAECIVKNKGSAGFVYRAGHDPL